MVEGLGATVAEEPGPTVAGMAVREAALPLTVRRITVVAMVPPHLVAMEVDPADMVVHPRMELPHLLPLAAETTSRRLRRTCANSAP